MKISDCCRDCEPQILELGYRGIVVRKTIGIFRRPLAGSFGEAVKNLTKGDVLVGCQTTFAT